MRKLYISLEDWLNDKEIKPLSEIGKVLIQSGEIDYIPKNTDLIILRNEEIIRRNYKILENQVGKK